MDLGIAGKVAFVSGGSKGIGRQCAEMLARDGCKVIVAARGQEAIDETVKAIRAAGGEATGISADLTSESGVLGAVQAARDAYGAPDIVITNVHGPGPGDFFDHSGEDFVDAFRDLALSVIFLARATLPQMKERGWGRLVTIGSGAAKEPPSELKHILANTARASVVSLNKSLANEFSQYGITVNTLATGWIGSERMYAYLDHVAEEKGITREGAMQMLKGLIPVGRPGKPEEMASLAVFLCSAQASYITGNLIAVDGGLHRSAW
ncbi:SDR family oxidoreductase [Noviherbaspirillum saxi]|uniref:SDR family oxidoreductase n=1 Tax=Noviherbaspirillum saxi TaxID=2320863 RepID=A0A3A3FK32_9BURK|nr:SDR family oxidoreductase [Noviherbaspirillum saxi]RJF91695.1 SDR family oxidoreductase [Noviherbaspirillum saxi]